MIHIYPDFMTSAGNLTMQLEFTQQYIQGHMDESQKLNKPLVIGEIGKEPPLADRNTYFSSVFQTAMQSAASGGTLAGRPSSLNDEPVNLAGCLLEAECKQ